MAAVPVSGAVSGCWRGDRSRSGSFRLDPADQIVPADRFQQGRMVGSHVPPDHPDHLVIVIAAGHEPAFASDQLHLAPPTLAACLSVMPGCWHDLGVLAPGAD